ncbi:hypothetical protein [Bacillus sp. AFS076308]|nr:hypothetical protein [Bacillus sp. AFS076308]
MMNVTIEIHYLAASRAMRRGSFPLRGKKVEYVALQFWKEIQREMSYRAKLEQVIVNGDKDITELVLELEKQERNKTINDDLPF